MEDQDEVEDSTLEWTAIIQWSKEVMIRDRKARDGTSPSAQWRRKEKNQQAAKRTHIISNYLTFD